MNDEKPFDLRDHFAAAAFQALLSIEPSFDDWSKTHYPEGIKWYNKQDAEKEYGKFLDNKIERAARLSYKAADQMRKARLAVFE